MNTTPKGLFLVATSVSERQHASESMTQMCSEAPDYQGGLAVKLCCLRHDARAKSSSWHPGS